MSLHRASSEEFRAPEYKMSSTLRRVSQIPVREKFFRAVAEISGTNTQVSASSPTAVYTSVMNATAFAGAFDAFGSTLPAGSLFRDMGRELIVTTPNAAGVCSHSQLYRNLQLVCSGTTEGVGGTNTAPNGDPYQGDYWVLVWDAAGAVPPVVRVG